MSTVKLRNGAEEFGPLVPVVERRLQSLMNSDPLAFYDLTMRCRQGRAYTMFPVIESRLIESDLLQANGMPHDSIRNIVLSAVEGDDLEMRLVSPLAASS